MAAPGDGEASAAESIRHLYADWTQYRSRLTDSIRGLTVDQLAIRAGPHHDPIWAIAAHCAVMRVYWLCGVLGEPGAETTPFPVPNGEGWEDDLDRPRTAAELIVALESTDAIVERCLDTWTVDMLEVEFDRSGRDGVPQRHTRRSVLMRSISHDAYHAGEISQLLGVNGLPAIDLWTKALKEDRMGTYEAIRVSDADVRIYEAGAGTAGAPGVVLLHAWWGLNDDVIAFADRLAGAGFAVIAPDLFGGQIATTVEDAEALAKGADEAAVDAVVLAAIDRLVERVGPSAKLAAVGFSFGAHWVMWSPARRDQVVASVLYYGTTDDSVLTEVSVPVQGHFAENDPFESTEWVDEFVGTLKAAGRRVELHRYPDTGHWFAEPSRDAYRSEAADLAFERTVDFLRRELSAPAG